MGATKQLNPKYIGVLALVSSVMLAGGWLARPREIPKHPPPIPSETELTQLAKRAERRSLEGLTSYFDVTAGEVESSVVHVPSGATSGIVWDTGVIVTAPLDRHAAETATVVSPSGQARVHATVWGAHLPLAAVESRGLSGLNPALRAASLPQAGDWVVAIWRTDRERVFAPGHFLQAASTPCGAMAVRELVSSLSLTRVMAGGGLFDIAGRLLAVILPCQERFVAVEAASVESMLRTADTVQQRVLAVDGLVLGALAEDEKAYFKTGEGVIVREVWTGSLGDEAGLRPGDIIGALDGTSVAGAEDLRALTRPPGEPASELTVRRGPKTLKIALPPEAAVEAASDAQAARGAGLVWEVPQTTYRIAAVRPASRAARAGIEPGDRLIRVDRAEPRSAAQVRQLLASEKAFPMFLEIERSGRRIGVLVR